MVVYSLTAFLKEMDRAKAVGWNLGFQWAREVSPKEAAVSQEGDLSRVGVKITFQLTTITWVLAWLPKSRKRNFVRAGG